MADAGGAESPWGRIGNVDRRTWASEPTRGKWVYAEPRSRPGLRIRFCFVDSPAGPTCVGIMFDRNGDEVTARDLRVPVGGFLDFGRASLPQFARVPAPTTRPRPPRRGPHGLPASHFEDIWRLYSEALRADRRAPIQWMCRQFDPPTPDATMRRWVARARELFEGEQ